MPHIDFLRVVPNYQLYMMTISITISLGRLIYKSGKRILKIYITIIYTDGAGELDGPMK